MPGGGGARLCDRFGWPAVELEGNYPSITFTGTSRLVNVPSPTFTLFAPQHQATSSDVVAQENIPPALTFELEKIHGARWRPT